MRECVPACVRACARTSERAHGPAHVCRSTGPRRGARANARTPKRARARARQSTWSGPDSCRRSRCASRECRRRNRRRCRKKGINARSRVPARARSALDRVKVTSHMDSLRSLLLETEALETNLKTCCDMYKTSATEAELKHGDSVHGSRANQQTAANNGPLDDDSTKHRLHWSRSLRLEYILAANLKPGTGKDGLEGIRSMTEEQVMQAFAQFSNKARDLVLKAWSELKATNALPLLTKDQTGGKHAHHFKIRMSAHLNTPLLVRNPRGHRPRGSARSVLRDHDGQGRIRPRLQAGPAGNRARRPPLRSVPPPR